MRPTIGDYEAFIEGLVKICTRGGAVFYPLVPGDDGLDVRVNAVRQEGPFGEFEEWFGLDIVSLAHALETALGVEIPGKMERLP